MPRLYVRALAAAFLVTAAVAAEPTPRTEGPAESAGRDSSLVYQPPVWPEPPNLGAMVLRLAVGTVFVLALCAGTLWAGKRWLGGPATPKGGGNRLRLVEALPLGGRCSLALLQVGSCRILAAVDSSGLKELAVVSEPFAGTLGQLEQGANLRA